LFIIYNKLFDIFNIKLDIDNIYDYLITSYETKLGRSRDSCRLLSPESIKSKNTSAGAEAQDTYRVTRPLKPEDKIALFQDKRYNFSVFMRISGFIIAGFRLINTEQLIKI
jgi:hypothetical protein